MDLNRQISAGILLFRRPALWRRRGCRKSGMEGFLGMGNKIEKVIIKGEDYDQIVSQANLVKYYLSQQQSVEWVNINIPSAAVPKFMLNFDKQLMSMYDIPASSVLAELNSFPNSFQAV